MMLTMSRLTPGKTTTRVVQDADEAAIEVRKIARSLGLGLLHSRKIQSEAAESFRLPDVYILTTSADVVFFELELV